MIYLLKSSTFENCTEFIFEHARYGSFGGAIFARLNSQILSLRGVVFTDNYVTDSGGAVYLEMLSIANRIVNCTFIKNSAQYDGGAIKVSDRSALNNLEGNLFADNSANDNGGAISIQFWMTAANFSDCKFLRYYKL